MSPSIIPIIRLAINCLSIPSGWAGQSLGLSLGWVNWLGQSGSVNWGPGQINNSITIVRPSVNPGSTNCWVNWAWVTGACLGQYWAVRVTGPPGSVWVCLGWAGSSMGHPTGSTVWVWAGLGLRAGWAWASSLGLVIGQLSNWAGQSIPMSLPGFSQSGLSSTSLGFNQLGCQLGQSSSFHWLN